MSFPVSKTHSDYPHSTVHPDATIGKNVKIGPNAVIYGKVSIGDGTEIGPNVVIYDDVQIGQNCRILPNTFISADFRQLEFWREKPQNSGLPSSVLIGDNVHIESNTSIHGAIKIQENCWIGSNVSIHDGARISANCKIFPGASIAAIPQDLKFDGERTTLEIGENTTVREFATLNRGTDYLGKTVVGSNVLIMAYVHIAHDCIIGDNVIMANAVTLGGHVTIDDYAVIGGMAGIHQFVTIGKHVMVAGASVVLKDVPPYIKCGRSPLQYVGVNSIGLRRRGFDNSTIHHIQEIYRHVFLAGMNNQKALAYVEAHLPATEERDEVITFIRNATRGIIKGYVPSSNSRKE